MLGLFRLRSLQFLVQVEVINIFPSKLLKIAVLGGTGDQGRGLAIRWSLAGYQVTLGSRSAARACAMADQLNKEYDGAKLQGADNRGAASIAEVIVLTVPYNVQRATVEEVREVIAGKILVDVTVPLVPPKVARVHLPDGGSAVVNVQKLLGSSVRVVSAFQNVSAQHLRNLDEPIDCDVLVCGDDVEAREVAIELANAGKMRGIHGGPLVNSVVAEALTSVLIGINRRYKVPGAGISITGLSGETNGLR